MKIEWWQIKDSIDYEEALDSLGIKTIRVDAGEHTASCPLSTHPGFDTNPSFSVNTEKGVYNCFSCMGGGQIPDLVADILGVSTHEAIQWLVEYSDVAAADEDDLFTEQVSRILDERKEERAQSVLPYFSASVLDKWTETETDWFESRGITPQTRSYFKLGFDPAHTRNSYVGPAIILPHFVKGQLVGWQERWLDEDRPKNIGKYTNTREFPARETLYNLDNIDNTVVVVEGIPTVARLYQLGIPAVATFGASVTPEQWELLRSVENVYLGFDNDDAGYIASIEGVRHLHAFTNVMLVPTPPTHKSNLGDVDDGEIINLLGRSVPGFLEL